jgi:dimethylhistidine N-methyltransferase
MDESTRSPPAPRRPDFHELDDGDGIDTRAELVAGLRAAAPSIAPKHLYDPLGSRLFEAICELPEYDVTRTEAAIMRRHGAEIALRIGPGCTLIDLGAGNCEKAERLFDLLRPEQYVAVDIAAAYLRERLEDLQGRHPALDVVGIGADFSRHLDLPRQVRRTRRVLFYPGSSIGNFTPPAAAAFLGRLRTVAGADGVLLLGVDMAKDKAALDAAYDDALGVTAAFNLNLLRNVNRLLGSDFDVRDWKHVAFYDASKSRIEMHLQARRDLDVALPDGVLRFRAGDRIHTENSYKYTPPALRQLLADGGFALQAQYADDEGHFTVALATVA